MAIIISKEDIPHEYLLSREPNNPVYLEISDNIRVIQNLVPPTYAAQIIRAENGFYAIVPSKENDVEVNGIKVFGIHILRDKDDINVSGKILTFIEWVINSPDTKSSMLDSPCPFCQLAFSQNDRVIHCPKCDTAMHDYDWDARRSQNEGCMLPNCGYIPPNNPPYDLTNWDGANG